MDWTFLIPFSLSVPTDLNPPQPDVQDIELIMVPPEQHEESKFTYAGLKQYLRLALYYTASFIHGTGCIALDGVFEDLATVSKCPYGDFRANE